MYSQRLRAEVKRLKVELAEAELDLSWTEVQAPVDGVVTNLAVELGSYAVAGQPLIAFVSSGSYRVHAYFRENQLRHIEPGDRAVVTLMSYPDTPLQGRVDSIGWGIAQEDGSTGQDLLPNINPTFEWIRLAQRIPVRIVLGDVPEDIALRVGATASVMVRAAGDTGDLTAAPAVLQ